MKAEEMDPIDERTVEVHEGHPVDVVVSVRLSPTDAKTLAELARREDADEADLMRLALRHYAAARAQQAGG